MDHQISIWNLLLQVEDIDMSDKKLFSLDSAQEITVQLKISKSGEDFELVHVFRQPTALDKKDFLSRRVFSEVSSSGKNETYLDAVFSLWGSTVVRVEGYELPEGCDEKTWKELIPLEHRLWAVSEMLKAGGDLDEISLKN